MLYEHVPLQILIVSHPFCWVSHSLYLLGLHSSWLLALRGASRWAGNTRWPGDQSLIHLSLHHLWDELAVLHLVITNQLHRWTHNLDKEHTENGDVFIEKITWLKCCWPRLDNEVRTDKQRRLNNTVVMCGRCSWCDGNFSKWNICVVFVSIWLQ